MKLLLLAVGILLLVSCAGPSAEALRSRLPPC
jgi:hypothetical protein